MNLCLKVFWQRQTETDRGRQRQTETDRDRQRGEEADVQEIEMIIGSLALLYQ